MKDKIKRIFRQGEWIRILYGISISLCWAFNLWLIIILLSEPWIHHKITGAPLLILLIFGCYYLIFHKWLQFKELKVNQWSFGFSALLIFPFIFTCLIFLLAGSEESNHNKYTEDFFFYTAFGFWAIIPLIAYISAYKSRFLFYLLFIPIAIFVIGFLSILGYLIFTEPYINGTYKY